MEEIKSNNALTLYSFKFTSDISLNENRFKDLLIPDGLLVAYVYSNFQSTYHPRFADYNKNIVSEFMKPKNSRGRKPKPKQAKIIKKNNGTNKEFASEVTLGIIYGDAIYSMKVFRTASGNIPSIPINNLDVAKDVINIAVRYLCNLIPHLNMVITDVNMGLRNCNTYYDVNSGNDFDDPVINMYRLRKVLSLNSDNFDIDINGENYICYVSFNNEKTKLTGVIPYKNKNFKFKFDPKGRLYIYGGNDDNISIIIKDVIFNIVDKNRDHLIQNGFPSIKAGELEELNRMYRETA